MREREGPLRTLLVALVVCAVCSTTVSATAVLLAPRHRANRERERREAVRDILASQPAIGQLIAEMGVSELEARVVDLASGEYAEWIAPGDYDQRLAASDPLQSVTLDAERDVAGLGRRARFATVYLVPGEDGPAMVLLPVHGRGYASTLYGYVALAGDGNTVMSLSFYEHGETPGIGGEVDDGDWLASWRGKHVRDGGGVLRIGVAPDEVDPASPEAAYQVDAIGGATRTSAGVTNLLRFWLGEDGFAPFLRRLQEAER